jgi:death-on-curing protein
VIYLTYPDLLYIGQRALGGDMPVRDQGLLESALARPRASALGTDAYETLAEKAAALTHSLARNHGLIDGNKRLTLAALIAFLGMNGRRLTWSNDEAYEFIVDVASGRIDAVLDIADRVARGSDGR